nr:hypothetical protein [Tanacetum cinerariifolium]
LGSLDLMKFGVDCLFEEGRSCMIVEWCQQGVVEHMWMVKLQRIVDSAANLKHWTSRREGQQVLTLPDDGIQIRSMKYNPPSFLLSNCLSNPRSIYARALKSLEASLCLDVGYLWEQLVIVLVMMLLGIHFTGHVRWGNLYVSDVGKRDGGEWITPEVRGFNTKAGALCIFDLLRKGKENEVNIPKSIDEVPFKMGILRETLTEGTEGALHLGPERHRVYSELTSKETDRFVTSLKLNRGLTDSNYDQLYAYLKQHEDIAFNVDNVFQVDDCVAFDYDVDEALTVQTMFMANLLSADPSYDEAVQVIQSDVSTVPNDAYMMILNDMLEPPAQHIYVTTQTKVVDKSLTARVATYMEQVKLYERQARFELTEREENIDEQLRIVITDRNIKEEILKKELYSIKMQLASTINHNKSMVEDDISLKKDFKQKENQYLEEFLDMKALKEMVEDKLFKQDQSL